MEIPNAKEFIEKNVPNTCTVLPEWLIEFAKLHVEAALKAASEKALTTWASTDFYDDRKIVSKDSILKAYPLTNIK
jgi:hypothetical protein